MSDFIQTEWKEFSGRLEEAAKAYAGEDSQKQDQFLAKARDFLSAAKVDDYKSLLAEIANGTKLILEWRSASADNADNSPDSSQQDESQTYVDSTNHEEMAIPQESMAEQAEEARSKPE